MAEAPEVAAICMLVRPRGRDQNASVKQKPADIGSGVKTQANRVYDGIWSSQHGTIHPTVCLAPGDI